MTATKLEVGVSQIVEAVRGNSDLSVTVSERPEGRTLVNVVFDTDYSSYQADLLVSELIKEHGFHVEYCMGETEFFKLYEN